MGGRWRTGKSDRLGFKSTHRRTLFNVSLTFLTLPPPHPLHRRQMSRELKQEMGWEGGRRRGCATLCLDFIQGHQPQTKSRVRGSWEGQPIGRWASLGRGGIRFHCQMFSWTVLPSLPSLNLAPRFTYLKFLLCLLPSAFIF